MKSHLSIGITIVAAIACLCMLWSWRWVQQSNTLRLRKSDVQALTQFYRQQASQVTNAGDLLALFREKGGSLYSPLPRDPAKPCYRLGSYATNRSPDAVVIEETSNVADEHLVVRSYGDGSIRIEYRE